MNELKEKCVNVKLNSFEDLARFASTLMSIGHGVYILHFSKNGKNYYGIFTVYRDYYKYYGIPLFYYVELKEPLKGKYVLIKVDEKGERVEVARGTRPGWIGIPIISLKTPPQLVNID